MVNLKKYLVYLDDGKSCYREAIPAASEEHARNLVAGNGEVIAVKEVTEDYPIDISKVRDALQRASFGQDEIDFIARTLTFITDLADC